MATKIAGARYALQPIFPQQPRRPSWRGTVGLLIASLLVETSPLTAGPTSYDLPDYLTVDKLGVDLATMLYERNDRLLSIGDPAIGGLSWSFIAHSDTDPYNGWISYWGPPAAGNQTQVKIAGAVTIFTGCQNGACKELQGRGTSLTNNGSNWIFTGSDGSIYTFSILNSFSSYNQTTQPVVTLGQLLSIRRPNGVTITINYYQGYAIQSVVSSGGYALKYNLASGVPTSISVVNLANHTCDVAVTACDGVDATISLSNFSGTSGLSGRSVTGTQVTTASGDVWRYSIQPIDTYTDPRNPVDWSTRDGLTYFRGPDGKEFELAYDAAGRVTSFTDYRGLWRYTYPDETLYLAEHGSTQHTIQVTDPAGAAYFSAHSTFGSGPIVDYVQDALGNKTKLGADVASSYQGTSYIFASRPASVTHPENDAVALTRDARGNIIAVTTTPKSGTGSIAITAAFPSTCDNPLTCNRPVSTTDANGNETDYTYDSAHGGVLTEMDPAPSPGAARPLKVTTWVSRYPYFRNASGTLVAGPTPIWVVTTQTQCQTVAGSNTPSCDAGAPQRVTSYEYGANGTGSNLTVKGIVVTASGTSQRICYGYDGLGNKIWETKPLGEGATPCS
ncbi:hypothetical protein ABDK56_09870 [Sphingomonas sp. ASV193]|uniref:hypothetical protein n=1 Tax=Sphingomonas sp. ASV193 TaxID=3144405 RepID=UPI0032E8ACCE